MHYTDRRIDNVSCSHVQYIKIKSFYISFFSRECKLDASPTTSKKVNCFFLKSTYI